MVRGVGGCCRILSLTSPEVHEVHGMYDLPDFLPSGHEGPIALGGAGIFTVVERAVCTRPVSQRDWVREGRGMAKGV